MKKLTKLRPSGYAVLTMPGERAQEWDTVQCVHCGGHDPVNPHVVKGGWCFGCNGYICSKKCATACVPHEQLLDNLEKNKPLDYRPVGIIIP